MFAYTTLGVLVSAAAVGQWYVACLLAMVLVGYVIRLVEKN